MNLPTVIISAIIAIIFIAIVVTSIINRKKGKVSCSCAGGCSGCTANGGCCGNTKK